ncbi:MAG: hypothetical protein LBV20_05675 [Treponema sp.]|jgi:tetratricopeptide (TPR) repeat protein|nr:hypothetical protein [Treponema sp.]
MMQGNKIKFWQILAIGLTLGFIVVSGAFAQTGDLSLSQADQLIAEKKYDAAIKVLTEYGKQHPDEFDQVQKRLQGIVRTRDEYNILAQQLLDVLKNDPNNQERIITLTRQIENLELEPNPVIGDFIKKTRELTLFTYNRAQLDEILSKGRDFLDRNNYSAALSMYSTGTSLYREEFYDAQYGDLVYSEVENDLQTINQSINEFNMIQSRVVTTLAEFETVAARTAGFLGLTELVRVFTDMETVLRDLISIRNSLSNAGASLQNQSTMLRQIDDTQGDAAYLPFLVRLIEGRSSENVPEGMLGTMDSLWLRARDSVLSSVIELTNESYRSALSIGKQSLFARSEQEFNGVLGFNDMILKTILWENQKEGLLVPAFIVVDGELVEQKYLAEYYQHYALSKSVPHIIAAQNSNTEFRAMQGAGFFSVLRWRDGLLAAADAIPQEENILLQFVDFEQEINNRLAAMEESESELNVIKNETGVDFDADIYLNEARSHYDSLLLAIFDQQKASVQRRYTIANGELDKRRARRQSEFGEANVLITGITRDDSELESLARYPIEANRILTELINDIPDDIQNGNDLIQQYSEELSSIGRSPEIVTLQHTAAAIVMTMENLRSSASMLSNRALNLAGEANSLKLDGDRLIEEALAAMNQNNFAMARDQLRRASDQYDASLSIQESASLRTLRDTQLINYYDEINRRENVLILVQVRRLVDQAKADFNLQNFERADDAISEAKTLYLRTNSETSEEILYWQGIVRNALSLRSGTVIPSTAPLYSEMSQLLRDAYLAYENGSRLFNQNQRAAGTVSLNEARQKLQEVRLIFPLNEEAGILGLRIDQLIDPGFNQKFQNLLDTAFQSVMRESSVEAYATLKNLSVINPNYPGIRNFLYQAGVHFGEIIPPPSAAAIARSNQLNASARVIIDSNVQSQFSAALEMLNEAIRLNPGNNTTAQLIDRVETLLGGTSTIMVSADKEKYNTAVREFQMGNRLIAQRLVDELLMNPRNRNSSELIQLKERIEAFL